MKTPATYKPEIRRICQSILDAQTSDEEEHYMQMMRRLAKDAYAPDPGWLSSDRPMPGSKKLVGHKLLGIKVNVDPSIIGG